MSVTYGLAADLHFHPWSAFGGVSPSGMSTRLELLLNELERVVKETASANGDYVVLAGDVFHVRGSVYPSVLNAVRDALSFCCEEYGVKFIILAGNHDLEGKKSERMGSAVTALESGFVQVVNAPLYHKATGTVLVPWNESVDSLKAEIERLGVGDMDFSRADLDLILHAPIDGVIDGLPSHGLAPEYLAGLGYRRVFAGHYHNHKEFPGRVYSIGALAHHTWSDVGSKAGFLLVGTGKVHWMKSHLPQFIDLDRIADIEDDMLPMIVDRNYVRVKTTSASASDVAKLREEIMGMGALGVLIQATPAAPVRDPSVVATISTGGSLESSIGMYAKTFGEERAGDVLEAAMAALIASDTGRD